jgi:hypothetical protein
MAWELLLLYFGGLMIVAGYLLRKEGEMDKEPEVYKLEPVREEAKAEELPQELLELFGLVEEEGEARGPLEAALANYLERKRIEAEIKTMRTRRIYKQELVKQEEVDKDLIDARIKKLEARVEAGLLSREQLALLERYFPEIYEQVKEAREMRKLKHLAERVKLEAEIAEKSAEIEGREGLEKYRKRWRDYIAKAIADLEGRHNFRKAVFEKIEEFGRQMSEDGWSEERIELFKAELKRDAERIILNLGLNLGEEAE